MFRYALNASTIRPTPILEKISIAGRAGYGAIELWHDEIDDHLAHGGTLADLQSALADQNLAVPTTIYLEAGLMRMTPRGRACGLNARAAWNKPSP